MTPQRGLIRFLDRPGGRRLLAYLATRFICQKTGLDVRLFYDGGWIRQMGDYFLAESSTFDWTAAQISAWLANMVDVFEMHRDWYFHQYEPREGDVVLDVGAGVGEDTILLSEAVGARGRVLAVEAHPETFRLLQKTCRYNRLENTVCVQRAIMDKAGSVHIESRSAHKGNTIALAPAIASHQVPACSLDELCAEHGITRIDFLKMNIEGAERFAIAGMRRIIEQTRAVCIACHDFLADQNEFYRTQALVVDFLRTNGFSVTVREQHPEPWTRHHVYGIKEAA